MKSLRDECVCENQFSNDNAPRRPSLCRPRLCRGSANLIGILRHLIKPSLQTNYLNVKGKEDHWKPFILYSA